VEGETGYLVPSGDDAAMAERIISLLNNRERTREMGEGGRRIVKEKFSCEAQLERTEKLYDELMANLFLVGFAKDSKLRSEWLGVRDD
jgi:glycosyltransferase involved in cell wall biosynthesis